MPTYEYECEKCGGSFEAFQSMTAEPLTDCELCGKGKVKRKLGTGAGIIFKGSGFYATDYKKSEGNGTGGKQEAKPDSACKSCCEQGNCPAAKKDA